MGEWKMKEIPLTRGKVAFVDDEDFDFLSKFKWYCTSHGYAQLRKKENGVTISISMHRAVLGLSKGEKVDVDHINEIKTDNRKENLRKCNRSENMRNMGMKASNTSGYKGVNFHKASKLWRSQIRLNMKSIHLGYFKNPEDAYNAYCEASKKYHGEFANNGNGCVKGVEKC